MAARPQRGKRKRLRCDAKKPDAIDGQEGCERRHMKQIITIIKKDHMNFYSCPECRKVIFIGDQKCQHCGCELKWQKEEIVKCPYCRKTLIGGRWVYFYSRTLHSKYQENHQPCPNCLEKELGKIERMEI
jgi:predicted RNA-binding Zn-ribbon protein involved in translation (DUF1610 family)